jgi:hypothetical protein
MVVVLPPTLPCLQDYITDYRIFLSRGAIIKLAVAMYMLKMNGYIRMRNSLRVPPTNRRADVLLGGEDDLPLEHLMM